MPIFGVTSLADENDTERKPVILSESLLCQPCVKKILLQTHGLETEEQKEVMRGDEWAMMTNPVCIASVLTLRPGHRSRSELPQRWRNGKWTILTAELASVVCGPL